MPRIPTALQQTDARGFLNVQPNVGSPGRGLANVGEALASAGRDMAYVQEVQDRKAEADALSDAHLTATKADADWEVQLAERARNVQPGAPEFTPTVLKDFDADAEKIVATAKTDRSKRYLQEQLASTRAQLGARATVFEANEGIRNRVSQGEQALDQSRIAVRSDPAKFDDSLATQLLAVEQMALPPVDAERLRVASKEGLASSAVETLIERDPYKMRKALAAGPGESGVKPVEALSADGRERALNAAESEINRREVEARAQQAENRDNFNSARQDALAAKAAGLPAELPGRGIYVAMDPKGGSKRYDLDQQLLATYDVASQAVMLPPDEGMAKVAAFRPTQQEGAYDQTQVQENAMRLYGQQRKAFEADPATWIVRKDADTRALLEVIGSGQAKPEQVAQYTSRIRAQQTAAGILEPKLLPAAYVEAMSTSLAFDPEHPGRRAETLQGMRQQWGSAFPQVVREISPKLEGDARVMVAMRPEVAKQYDQVLANKDKITSLVPADSKKTITEQVSTELEGLAQTLMNSDDGQARLAEIKEASQTLAISYTANGTSPAEAATKATQVVVNERYGYRDTLRVPVRYDADAVEAGAIGAKLEVKAGTLMIAPMPGQDAAAAQDDLKKYVDREGYWVTTSDESGAELHVPYQGGSVPVTRTDGSRIRYNWAELAAHSSGKVPDYIRLGLPK